MEDTPKLYDTLTMLLKPSSSWLDQRHYQTFAWMILGLLYGKTVNLSEWADFVVSRAQFAQSTVRRFTRWLNNPRIQVQKLYAPMIQQVLATWEGEKIYVALDTSMLWGGYYIIRLALVYRGRSVPLVWKVIRHNSSTVGFHHYQALLMHAAELLPDDADVVFLADRGFVSVELMVYLRDSLHWHWHIRIKTRLYVFRKHHRRIKVSSIRLQRGQVRYWHNVYLTKQQVGPVHLALAKPLDMKETWLIVSDLPTDITTLEEYGLRFDIEEGFLDDKSNGFQLTSSQIRSPEALERLLFVLAVATLFLVSQGVQVVATGKRRWIDPHWFRGLSYFKIGWKWVRRAAVKGWSLITRLELPPGPDPEPAKASRIQAQKRVKITFSSTQTEAFGPQSS